MLDTIDLQAVSVT